MPVNCQSESYEMSAGEFLTIFIICSRIDCAETESLQTKVLAEQNSHEYGNGGGKDLVVGIKISF